MFVGFVTNIRYACVKNQDNLLRKAFFIQIHCKLIRLDRRSKEFYIHVNEKMQ